MERLAKQLFPSVFLTRTSLNFEGQCELNLRIAYDDDFHKKFGSSAKDRYQI